MKPRKDVGTLDVLNRKAVENAFGVEALDWARPVERGRFWAPEQLISMYYLPSYAKLSPEEKRRCNQLYAMGICEQIIWLEENFLVKTLRRVLKRADVPAPLRTALDTFIDEEIKHTEMFWRTLEKAEPTWYKRREFRVYLVPRATRMLVNAVLSLPKLFIAWIWVAIFFEERTVDYWRNYLKARKEDPAGIDESVTEVQEFHFKDEIRHFQLDQHLLTWLYDPQPAWKRRLAGKMFTALMRGYVYPKNIPGGVMAMLGEEFPRLRTEIIPAMRSELIGLGTSRDFHDLAFSRGSVPKAMALFAEYPELDGLWPMFLAVTKEEFQA